MLWGDAFAQVVRNGRGQAVALYPLLPNKMDVSRALNGELVYTYHRDAEESRLNPNSGTVTLRRDEVLHVPGLGFDGLVGYSPIAMAKNATGLSLAIEEFGATFFANGANSHKVAVLEEGLKFHQMSIPLEDAQFLEIRKFQIDEIARIFRVPPHMVSDLENSSFSNIEQQSLEFVKSPSTPGRCAGSRACSSR